MKKTAAMVALFLAITLLLTSCAKQTEAEGTTSTEVTPFTPQQIIADNTVWYASGDSSCIHFEEDGTFLWHEDEALEDYNYYIGTYEIATGQKARDVLTEILNSYNFSESAIDSFLEYRWGDAHENFVCITIRHTGIIVEGEEQRLKDLEIEEVTLYAYFMNGDEILVLADVANQNLFSFVKYA